MAEKKIKTAKKGKKQKSQIPEKKLKAVSELTNLAKTKKTILLASIKNLPASQFQEICKQLRGKAIVKFPKKNITLRALEDSKVEEIEKIKDQIDKDVAILFSDLDAFELSAELVENRSRVKAKTGQEALEDISVDEGPTDLIPGPAVSELGALGIKIIIEGGKINIKEPKVIVKKGQKISENAAGLMNKLGIKPFYVGFEPVAAFDIKEKKLYLNIKINKEETLKELKDFFARALPFAVEIGYITEDTIKFMIAKAGIQEKALGKLLVESKEEKVEEVKEESVEEKTEETPQINQGEENK
jgi:large subunit ribosomal protein L10